MSYRYSNRYLKLDTNEIDIPLLNSLHVGLSKRNNLMGIIYLLVVPSTILYSSVAWLIENMGG
jgi:hypothetical protein